MSGCSCHVETIAPLEMMSNYKNEAEIRDHVFGKEPLRPLPPSASPSSDHSVPSCQKSFRVFRVFRGPTLRHPSSAPTWAGKPMPRGTGFPARGFGTALRPPFTPFPPIKNSSVCSVCSVGQPSAIHPPASAFPSSIRLLRLLRVFAANPETGRNPDHR